MKRIVYSMVFLLVFSVGVLQAQTTVVSDTFTVAPERPAGEILPGQMTEVGDRIWHGETYGSHLKYYLMPAGNVERYGGTSHNDRTSTVAYTINPEGEVVTLQADFMWPTGAADNTYVGVGFIKASAIPDLNNIMLWQYNTFSIRLQENGGFELFGDKVEQGDPAFRWIVSAMASPIPFDTEVTVKLQYDSVNGTLSGWVGGTPIFTDEVIANYNPAFDPSQVGWAAFQIRAATVDGYGITCDNFLITSTNPLLNPPPIFGEIDSLGTDEADPELLDWISIDGQVYAVGEDLLQGAGYDIDPDYTLYSTDPNGPRFCQVCIDDAASPPLTQLDAEALTADGKLSSGCTLDFAALPDHKASIGQFVFDMPITTHDGADIVVISLDRDTDCGDESNEITLLDVGLIPIPGQTAMVACGQTAWFTTPGDDGTTQNYDVTGVDPSFGLTLSVDSTVTRAGYTAYAIDVATGMTLGGIRIVSESEATPVEVFAIPETGSYLWRADSCEAGIYAQTDLNKDCITDLEDFALIAASWLECNTLFDASCW
ncbi:MAG: hypothetical protein JW709_10755 [Sedimentisphaerales bacterium]|nr:hypothetical protein [Sedimentisphaerales bacterium]